MSSDPQRVELSVVPVESHVPSACFSKPSAAVEVFWIAPSSSELIIALSGMVPGRTTLSETDTLAAEQLILDGLMVTVPCAGGSGVDVGVGATGVGAAGGGRGGITNVKGPCARTLPFASTRRAVWTPAPMSQWVEPVGLVSLTDQVPSGFCAKPNSATV